MTRAGARAVLVTGASRGIGRAVAVGLAEDGADVVGVHYGGRADAAQQTADLVAEAGARPVLLQASFERDGVRAAQDLAERFLAEVEAALGERRVDVLVNNAGISGGQAFGEVDEDGFRRVVDVNLTVPLFLTQALLPELAPGGRVLFTSSGFTRVAAPQEPVYAATKGALNVLVLAVAPVLGARGATVNAVMPGITDTDATAGWLSSPGAREAAGSMSVLGRVGSVDDVAAVIRFLASDAGRWVTGQVVDASGGTRL